MSIRIKLGCVVLAVCSALGTQAALANDIAKATKAIPAADFFAHAKYSDMMLSPDGQHLAALATSPSNTKMLVSINLQNMTPSIVISYTNADVSNIHWVNNKRLIYSLWEHLEKPGDFTTAPGLFAINLDGSEQRQLVARHWNIAASNLKSRQLTPNTRFLSTIANGTSDDIYVIQSIGKSSLKRSVINLLRVDTMTGISKTIDRPGQTLQWLIDKDGVPRVAITYEDDVSSVFYRDSEKSEWRKLYNFSSTKDFHQVLQLGANDSLYVTDYQGKDTSSLYRYDIKANKLDPAPVVSLDGFDFSGRLLMDKQYKVLGVTYESDARGTQWFDKDMQEVQKKIDTLLPNTINSLQFRTGSPNILVHSHSDVEPGAYALYKRDSDKLIPVGRIKPEIRPELMSNKDFVKITARDGLQFPAYLTLPKGYEPKKLPMVLMVHGGPNVRGAHWNWDRETQFLASRGYAVLEPEFRGSTGYGKKLEQAGWKQWGLKMQDDLVDAVKWAVDKGYVDPQRVCIAGASYGGYAALMGAIRDANLYQCAISWVGVTDIDFLFSVSWSDSLEETEKYWMPMRIGDPKLDAARFKETSPLTHAKKLKIPLILAYGAHDRRVPIIHGQEFYNAVKSVNPNVDWIVYKNEGHGWYFPENNVDFWTRVETFLNQHTAPKKN